MTFIKKKCEESFFSEITSLPGAKTTSETNTAYSAFNSVTCDVMERHAYV